MSRRSPGRSMRILVNFTFQDLWSVHCLGADGKTLISPWLTVRTEAVLLCL
jgi:hypothetical protein